MVRRATKKGRNTQIAKSKKQKQKSESQKCMCSMNGDREREREEFKKKEEKKTLFTQYRVLIPQTLIGTLHAMTFSLHF